VIDAPEPLSDPALPVPKRTDPARQAGLLVLGTTLATLASALAPLLVVRLIGKADVGRLLSVTLVYETVAMLLGTGLPYALLYQLSNREGPERAAIARRIFRTAMTIGAAGAGLLVLVSLVLRAHPFGYAPTPTLDAQLEMLLVLGPSLIADLPFRLMPNLLIAEGKAGRSAGLQVVRTLALTLATLVPLALNQSVFAVIACSAVVRWLCGGFVVFEIGRLYHALPRVAVPLTMAALWRFALPLGATEVLGLVSQQLDRWLVLLALPAERFAEYQIGAWQVPIIGTIAYSVGAAYMPELVKRFQEKDPYGALSLWQRGIQKTALIVVPVTMALVVGAEELVTVLFTDAYLGSVVVFRLYSVLTFLRVAAFGTVVVAAGRPAFAVRAAGVGLFCNALLGVVLVSTVGFVGPAIAAAVAFVIHVATYLYYIARAADVPVLKVFPVRAYARVFALATIAGGAGYLVKRSVVAAPGLGLALVLLVVLGLFAVLATATKTIVRSDWAYVWDWVRLRTGR